MDSKMSVKSLQTLGKNSTEIAGVSDGGDITDGLFWHTTTLHLHKEGKWYLREHGGPAMDVEDNPEWLTRDEAVKWIATTATDSITGYGFSEEQAEVMVDGGDAGKGYRGQ